jgi:hypothetical protein
MLIMGHCDKWIIWMFRNLFNLSYWMPRTHSLLISTQNGFGRKKKTLENFIAWRKKPSHDQLGLHKVLTYLLWKHTLGNEVWKKWVGEKKLVFKLRIVTIQLHLQQLRFKF